MEDCKKCNNFKSGVVVFLARPSVGKSTLLNKILGQKVAITTPVPQTTRKNLKGIYTDSDSQIIFIDTPGIHKPKNQLGEFLSKQSKEALEGADLVLFMVDCSNQAGRGDLWIYENYLKNLKTPILLVLNKIDLVKNLKKREENFISYLKLFPHTPDTVRISAKTGKNTDDLINKIKTYIKTGEKFYDEDMVADTNMREIASEIIREKIIFNTKEEVPHSIAVLVEEYREELELDRISAKIIVNTDSQKGILIGKKGSMLKKIGTSARIELEKITQKKVFLELFVKVEKNWLKNPKTLQNLGYKD